MNELKKKNTFEKSREHLANERTFLAWIRTSIALMGFGFVIVKFTLFLKEISLLLEAKDVSSNGFSICWRNYGNARSNHSPLSILTI
jgi:putative membrane protein